MDSSINSINPGGEPTKIVSDESKTTAAVWSNKPLNGVVEESVVSTPVVVMDMDVGLWPALGDSTKPASESLPEVTGNSSNKPAAIANNEATATTTATTVNNVASSGQKTVKRVGGGGSSGAYVASNGIVTLRSAPSHEAAHATSGKPFTVAVDSNPKEQTFKDSARGNDQHYQRGSYRRGGNGANHPRGGDNYGGKVDHGRVNQEWNQHRNFPPHRGGYRRGGYVRPTIHNAPPVLPPMHMQMHPFANNVLYPDVGSMIYFSGPAQPMVPGPMFFPFVDPVLPSKILNQINYYFSNENLVKDPFLRRAMDEEGWVSVNLIAGFKKVSSLTDNVQLILNVMRSSDHVEVQGDKMRRRSDWMRWLLPSVGDSLASQLQGIGLSGSRSSSSMELQQGGGRERAGVV